MNAQLPWCEPEALAASLAEQYSTLTFLSSSLPTSYSGRYSYLAWDAVEIKELQHFSELDALKGYWFGHISYEMLGDVEALPLGESLGYDMPVMRWSRYRYLLKFDHQNQSIESLGEAADLPAALQYSDVVAEWNAHDVASNMTKEHYLSCIENTLEKIRAGSFYQANITRKFFGKMEGLNAPFQLFRRLCEISPAPYSAFIKHENDCIISSSPELFLRVDNKGNLETRPIKGSAGNDLGAGWLSNSEKDKAENLMIVDLMRNDLSRVARSGSVEVPKLYEIDSFATIHHMSSSVVGKLEDKYSAGDAIRECFPPGSMTGAPKIAAMQWCQQCEHHQRGVYSGAIGWLHDGACELSVVIRTIILQGDRFEFQVGGGIVADSDPEREWEETLTKAKGVSRALNLDIETLRAL